MKLGIFGDSFSGSKGPTSWATLLSNECEFAENFSEPGTSLFHAYQHFLSNYKKYDTIIFTITASGRLYTNIPPDILCICNLFVVEHLLGLDNIKQNEFYNEIKAAEQYYMYLQNTEFDLFAHDAILEKIISLSNKENINLILLPCMREAFGSAPDSFNHCSKGFHISLINELEREFFKIPQTGMHFERKDRLQNHMSDENNLILSNLITKIFNGENIKIDIDMFDPEPSTDVNIYYDMEEIQKL